MADHDTYIRLRGRYAELLQGKIKVEDLDDDEVARGQLKAVDGTFRGRPPQVIPTELVNAMRKEFLARAERKLAEALMQGGVGTLVNLATDIQIDPAVRLRAAQTIIERNMGKVPDKIQLGVDDPLEKFFTKVFSDPNALEPGPSAVQVENDEPEDEIIDVEFTEDTPDEIEDLLS